MMVGEGASPVPTEIRSVFKKIIKRRARIIRALTALARSFFFHHHADGIKRALVAFVFGRDSGGNWLIAFEAARRVKMFALFAGVEVESAFWALPDRIGGSLQQRAAFRTPGNGSCSGHVHRTRSEGVFSFRLRRGLLELFFWSATGILVSALAIFAVGQEVPPCGTLILRLWRAGHKRFFG